MWRAICQELRRWATASTGSVATYTRTEVTVETGRIWRISRERSRREWCAQCRRETEHVGLREAAALYGANMAQASLPMLDAAQGEDFTCTQPLSPGADRRGWHWSQASDGLPMVCLESLRKSM